MRAGNISAVSSLLSHMHSGGKGEEDGSEGRAKPPRPNSGTWGLFVKAHIDSGDYKGALRAIERGEKDLKVESCLWLSKTNILDPAVELADKAGDEGAVAQFKRMRQDARMYDGRGAGLPRGPKYLDT